MTRCSHWWSAALLLGCLLGAAGCESQTSDSSNVVLEVKVTLAGEPLGDVRVALLPREMLEAGVVLEGITDGRGVAGMVFTGKAELLAEPAEYVVVCESLGDWQIASPWNDAKRTPLVLTWPGNTTGLQVALPPRAVRSL